MSLERVKKYNFVLPGVYFKEIDETSIPVVPGDIGPVVIGRATQGPTMYPVTVKSQSEFEQIFGTPSSGPFSNVNMWYAGADRGSPTFGAYAAWAWLANASPLTFVRLCGEQNDNAEESGYAGWNTGVPTTASIAANAGAYGLFVGSSGSIEEDGDGKLHLASIFYVTKGAVCLSGTYLNGDPSDKDAEMASLIKADSDGNFTAVIYDGDGGSVKQKFTVTSNMGDVFNRTPYLTNSAITNNSTLKTYWLGEYFKQYITEQNLSGTLVGCILPLHEVSNAWSGGDYRRTAVESKSGWIISQDLYDNPATYDPRTTTQKLFRFVSLDKGDNTQKNVKISITDIKYSPNEDVDPYGRFTVLVRKRDDVDKNEVVLEAFTNCSLDPTSTDYIAYKIGDKYRVWSEADSVYREYGMNDNNSKYIRVEMDEDVTSGAVAKHLLPFGFYAPTRFDTGLFSFKASLDAVDVFDEAGFPIKGTPDLPSDFVGIHGAAISGYSAQTTASFEFPEFPMVSAISSFSTPQKYWGIDPFIAGSDRISQCYLDVIRTKPAGLDAHDEGTFITSSHIFSLDNVGFASVYMKSYDYTVTNRTLGESITSGQYYVNSSLTPRVPSYKYILDLEGVAQFTTPLYGGFDGLDITEKEPFKNTGMGTTKETDYRINTLIKAIDICKDPKQLLINIACIPGVTNSTVTDYLMNKMRDRADTLSIIDIAGDVVMPSENASTEATNRPSVTTAVATLKGRYIDNNTACCYYPAPKITYGSKGFYIPASAIALGVMAGSQKQSELFFAPAGFNRGGLNSSNCGLNVTGLSHTLTMAEQESLYGVGINPIIKFATMSSEKHSYVVYGQKTLQAKKTSLSRINNRRLLNHLKVYISQLAERILFDQNIDVTWARFTSEAVPFLENIKSRLGIEEFKLVLDNTTTTDELRDRNIVYAQIYIKPLNAIEYMAIDFILTNNAAAFAE